MGHLSIKHHLFNAWLQKVVFKMMSSYSSTRYSIALVDKSTMALTTANSFTLSGTYINFFYNTNNAGHQFYTDGGESVNVHSRLSDSGTDMTVRQFYKAAGYNALVSKRML